ncbi:MAG TPA: tRNA (adenine-N1)-methyltransferase [Acidimicrobiales bacterium]|nr:tRNA (adenine-N1)-methyltransferase [Acidimicrobiales bacterium]
MTSPFREGERVLLLDRKGRRYLITLAAGSSFHSHAGWFGHDDLIGAEEGTEVRSTAGARYVAVRPTLSDFVLKMPRGAQVIYPKDLGQILVLADVFPGARVLEAGVGSGALSMTLLRAGAEVYGYEVREDFAARARANVESFLGTDSARRFHVADKDVYEGIAESGLDRIVLDLPEPWRVVPHAGGALRPGGLLVSYVPTISQAAQLRETLDGAPFVQSETLEVLLRTWHVEGRSVRPDHRMVAHTGFITHARFIGREEPTG